MDLLSGCREDPPRSAELVDALAGRLSGPAVADEVVERVAAVRYLELPVGPLRRPEQRRPDTWIGDRLPLCQERRPQRSAGAVARALRSRVLHEVVQRDAAAVDDDAAERRASELDDGAPSCGAGGRTGDCDRSDDRGSDEDDALLHVNLHVIAT